MIATLMAMMSGVELGMFIGPLWRKLLNRGEKKDILIYGVKQPRSLPFIDKQLAKRTGELNWAQKKAHDRFLSILRTTIDTKAFELATAKLIKDKWMFKDGIQSEFKVI